MTTYALQATIPDPERQRLLPGRWDSETEAWMHAFTAFPRFAHTLTVVQMPDLDADEVTDAAIALLDAAPGSFSTTTNNAYVGCPGCRESVYEHSIPKHAATCAPLLRLAGGGR